MANDPLNIYIDTERRTFQQEGGLVLGVTTEVTFTGNYGANPALMIFMQDPDTREYLPIAVTERIGGKAYLKLNGRAAKEAFEGHERIGEKLPFVGFVIDGDGVSVHAENGASAVSAADPAQALATGVVFITYSPIIVDERQVFIAEGRGLSAYEIAVKYGYTGTEEAWVNRLDEEYFASEERRDAVFSAKEASRDKAMRLIEKNATEWQNAASAIETIERTSDIYQACQKIVDTNKLRISKDYHMCFGVCICENADGPYISVSSTAIRSQLSSPIKMNKGEWIAVSGSAAGNAGMHMLYIANRAISSLSEDISDFVPVGDETTSLTTRYDVTYFATDECYAYVNANCNYDSSNKVAECSVEFYRNGMMGIVQDDVKHQKRFSVDVTSVVDIHKSGAYIGNTASATFETYTQPVKFNAHNTPVCTKVFMLKKGETLRATISGFNYSQQTGNELYFLDDDTRNINARYTMYKWHDLKAWGQLCVVGHDREVEYTAPTDRYCFISAKTISNVVVETDDEHVIKRIETSGYTDRKNDAVVDSLVSKNDVKDLISKIGKILLIDTADVPRLSNNSSAGLLRIQMKAGDSITVRSDGFVSNALYRTPILFVETVPLVALTASNASTLVAHGAFVGEGEYTTTTYNAIDDIGIWLQVRDCKYALLTTVGGGTGEKYPTNELAVKFVSSKSDKVTTTRPAVIAHISDVHANWGTVKTFNSICDRFDEYVDVRLNTGDTVFVSYEGGIAGYLGVENVGKIVNVIGNHDVWDSSLSPTHVPDAYTRYVQPFVENWNLTNHPDGKCYFYKDIEGTNVRLVCLNVMQYDDDQHSWFVEALDSAKTLGYTVVVAIHTMPCNTTKVECSFSDLNPNLDEPYHDNSFSPNSKRMSDAVQNFIDVGGLFACWMVGHYHDDYIGRIAYHPSQLVVAVGASASGSHFVYHHIFGAGDKSEDCINVLSINHRLKTFSIFRIGRTLDQYQREKRSITFDYARSTLLSSV